MKTKLGIGFAFAVLVLGTSLAGATAPPIQQHGVHFGKPSRFRIGHAPFERFGNPRIIRLEDKLGDFRPLPWRQRFELLDNGLRCHVSN